MFLDFHESVPTGNMLLETRLFNHARRWEPLRFLHRTAADLLEAVETYNQSISQRPILQACEFPVYTCEVYPVGMEDTECVYHKLLWGQDGQLKGYGNYGFSKALCPGFYSIRNHKHEIRLLTPGYSGEVCRITVSDELVFYIEPDMLELFQKRFSPNKNEQMVMMNNGKLVNLYRFAGDNVCSMIVGHPFETICLSAEIDVEMQACNWRDYDLVSAEIAG